MTKTINKKFLKNLIASDLNILKINDKKFINIISFETPNINTIFYLTVNKLTQEISLYQNEYLLTNEKNICRMILNKFSY